MNNHKAGAFDGFSLQTKIGSSATNLYSGDTLETRYRGGFVIGLSVAVSLKNLFSGSASK
jgi:hypothetical protein